MTMKLSENTFNLLKNFSGINQSISVKSGNTIRTISVAENILAEADVEETFPKNFSIYDLNEFLGGMSLMRGADMEFGSDHYVKIKNNRSAIKYFFADSSLIKQAPDQGIKVPSADVNFVLSESDIQSLTRAAAVYQLPDFSVIGDSTDVTVLVRDKENDTSNTFSINVGKTDDEFVLNMKVENLKLIRGDYDVVMSKRLISRFTNKSIPVTYWIALEPDSN